LLVREGDQVPGFDLGIQFTDLIHAFYAPPNQPHQLYKVALNSAGECAFPAMITGISSGGTPMHGDCGVWIGPPDNLRLLARGYGLAPGTGPDVIFATFSECAINALGRCVFRAQLMGPGIHDSNDSGIWFGAPGALAKIFREGDPAPVPGEDFVFGDAASHPLALNDRGEVLFSCNRQ
jgi:hypothetical protein